MGRCTRPTLTKATATELVIRSYLLTKTKVEPEPGVVSHSIVDLLRPRVGAL